MSTLDVIFRFDTIDAHQATRGPRECTAVFPSEPGNVYGSLAVCYAHVGQHGVCSRAWYTHNTRAATPEEYGPLLRELEGIYQKGPDAVTLRVRKRWTARHDRMRMGDRT